MNGIAKEECVIHVGGKYNMVILFVIVMIITVLIMTSSLSEKDNKIHNIIMSKYSKDKDKIIISSNDFFRLRHSGGIYDNRGLFFPNGYNNPPVYEYNGKYIEIEFKE